MSVLVAHILTILIALPLVAAAGIALLPGHKPAALKGAALFASAATFGVSLVLALRFDPGGPSGALQFNESYAWITAWNAFYRVGIDGTGLSLVLLTAGLFPFILYSGFSTQKGLKAFLVLLLLLEGALIGAFVSLDLLLFYIFWELTLIPIFFLVGIWGGVGRKRSTLTFFIYTMVGSLALLLGIAFLYHYSHGQFNLLELEKTALAPEVSRWIFGLFALAFLIKTPIFGLHRWLPDVYADAPTAATVALAALLSKLGVYGLIRFCLPLFGPVLLAWQGPLMLVCAVGVVYASLLAWVQDDIKRVVAYASMAHMGVILAGVFSLSDAGVAGSLFSLVGHGAATALLFSAIGILEDRGYGRSIRAYGGLARKGGLFALFFFIAILSTLSLPGTSGFVGEILILMGSFRTHPWITAVIALGAILSAVYGLRLYQALFFGSGSMVEEGKTIPARAVLPFTPLVALLIFLGIRPAPILHWSQAARQELSHSERRGDAGGRASDGAQAEWPSTSGNPSGGRTPSEKNATPILEVGDGE